MPARCAVRGLSGPVLPDHGDVRISAKADYAVRACVELAGRGGADPVSVEVVGGAQGIPVAFLERIVGDLRRAGLVSSVRRAGGGYRLARPASEVTVAVVVRAVDGPLVFVRG